MSLVRSALAGRRARPRLVGDRLSRSPTLCEASVKPRRSSSTRLGRLASLIVLAAALVACSSKPEPTVHPIAPDAGPTTPPTPTERLRAFVIDGPLTAADLVAADRSFAAGDLDGALAIYSTDTRWEDMGSSAAPYRGRGALRVAWSKVRASFPDAASDTSRLFIFEDHSFLVQAVSHGTHTGPLEGLAPTERSYSIHQAQVSQVSGGKIVASRSYMDSLTMLAQLGLIRRDAPVAGEVADGQEIEVISGAPSAERSAALRTFYRRLEAGETMVYEELFASAVRVEDHSRGLAWTGPREGRAPFEELRSLMPKVHFRLDAVHSAADWVAVELTSEGIHLGDYEGRPPSGGPLAIRALHLFHFAGPQVDRVEIYQDNDQILRQMPQPGAGPPH